MIFTKQFITRMGSLFVLALLGGCQHDVQPGQAYFASSCSSNPYLMKYHCSIERIQQEAERGSADAQYALGYMYYYGISTVRDEETAELWIRRSALQGQPLAKRALSLIQSNASFNDLHQEAVHPHQPQPDVSKMNSQVPSEPITQHLPAYQDAQTQTKQPVLDSLKNHPENTADNAGHNNISVNKSSAVKHVVTDPRLSNDAKPIAAVSLHQQSTHEKSKYTIQLMASNDRQTLITFIHRHRLAVSKTHIYRTLRHGKPWYMLIYGSYSTETSALLSLRELSLSIKRNHPWVKSMATIKREIKEQKIFS